MIQRSQMPTAKVAVGAFAGAMSTLVVWLAHQYGKVEIPAEAAVAISTVIAFVASYFTWPAARDGITEE